MSLFLILLAAGDGNRLKSKTPKPYNNVNSKTILEYSLNTFGAFKEFKKIVIVFNKKHKKFLNKIKLKKNVLKIIGGRSRQESALKALKKIKKMNCGKVFIHDVARPNTSKNLIRKMKNYFKYMAILALGIVSCEPELENSIEDGDFYTRGEADFSNYVALGNSLTSGYADGALYLSGQQNSFPSILAEKFSAVQETGEFIQPLVNDNNGGLLLGGNQITENRFVLAVGASGPSPARYTGAQPTTEVSNKFAGPVNNMGVPGAKSYHLLAENYGSVAGVAAGTTQAPTPSCSR